MNITISDFLIFLKIGIIILIFLYAVFGFVVLNQIFRMNNIIKEVYSSALLYVLAIIHMVLAISLLLAALVIL